MTRRRKLRNVRYRQWVRWLYYRDNLPTDRRNHKLKVPKAWYPAKRWWK